MYRDLTAGRKNDKLWFHSRKEKDIFTLFHGALTGNYLITPCRRVLLEKLTGSQLVKKFYETPKVPYHVYKFPPLYPILSQFSPVHAPHPTFCTKTHDSFPLLGLHKRINPGPMQMYRLCNKDSFDDKELLAPRQNYKMEYQPLSVVGDCFFNIFLTTLHIADRFSNRNLRTRHAVVTGTQFSWYKQSLGPTMSPGH
jgi:hypothetical protein